LIHHGGGKSVPEPQGVTGFGCQSIVIGPRPSGGQMVQYEFWPVFRPK
jgi:hypothetical protein